MVPPPRLVLSNVALVYVLVSFVRFAFIPVLRMGWQRANLPGTTNGQSFIIICVFSCLLVFLYCNICNDACEDVSLFVVMV